MIVQTESTIMTRRKSGGREARIALRNAPLKEEEKPVNAGRKEADISP